MTVRAGAGEVDRVGAEAASDLEHALPGPALELGKAGNVRLDEVFPRFHFIEVLRACRPVLESGGDCTGGCSSIANPIDGRLAERGALADVMLITDRSTIPPDARLRAR